jgi:hypothetical protein
MTCVEKGVQYELVPIDYGSDAHGALHPFRHMPILEIDGTIIVETLAITATWNPYPPPPRRSRSSSAASWSSPHSRLHGSRSRPDDARSSRPPRHTLGN